VRGQNASRGIWCNDYSLSLVDNECWAFHNASRGKSVEQENFCRGQAEVWEEYIGLFDVSISKTLTKELLTICTSVFGSIA
jgi:hypothetical protein